MSKRYVCLHGHFYQPPRDNPWLNKVEIQDSAYPYHDWNHRINAECYSRNAASRILNGDGKIEEIINNYARMSFNMGPTLLEWMEKEAPDTYQAILDADTESRERYSGHGSALAQAYNHMIMPLANRRDKETQVIWGIADFKSRFNREPEGMWLGETAVDTETLEVLAENGIKFTILSPYQAKNTRKIGDEKWEDATGAKVNTKRAYVCNLPSGKKINLFFYDGEASQGVAFEGLLNNGEDFANRLMGRLDETDDLQLVNIATDGESYGHHHKNGEMALSYCLHSISEREDVTLTIYGEFLEKFPPEYEAEILENTSWSCAHGVERWKSNCGCNTGGNSGWNQEWRAPLRETFDWVREELIPLFEEKMTEFSVDPWEIRNKYIDVITNRSQENMKNFLRENFQEDLSEEQKVTIWKLLEMQYHAMLMYTSCGWFFDEVTGLESTQDILYASRALQLATDISGNDYEKKFVELLEKTPSNIPEFKNAAGAYNRFVKPMALDMIRIGAHYAISSVFEEFPEEIILYNFNANTKKRVFYEAGKQKLLIGHTIFQSNITWEKVDISYAVLHLGEHHLFGGVREFLGSKELEESQEQLKEAFYSSKIHEVFNIIDNSFGSHNYSFWHLFRDEQKSIMQLIMENVLETTEGTINHLFQNNYPVLQVFKEIKMKAPRQLKLPVELALNTRLIKLIDKEKENDLEELKKTLEEAEKVSIDLDLLTLNYMAGEKAAHLLKQLQENPHDENLLRFITDYLKLINNSKIEANYWEAQNIAFMIRKNHYENQEQSKDVVAAFDALYSNLNLVV